MNGKNIFRKSLKDNYEVNYILADSNNFTKTDYHLWIYKTKLVISLIEENFGENIIISDIDIQFFKKTEHIVKQYLLKYDIIFQGENKFNSVNIGFIAIKCDEEVLRFWNKVLEIVESEKYWDQQVVNDLLSNGYKINWAHFPESIWNWNLTKNWENIALHHATNAVELEAKLLQMRIVKFVYYMKFFNQFEITYKIARSIFRKYKRVYKYMATQHI